jgi:ribosomal protein L40E
MDIEQWRREMKIRDENESDYSICMKCGAHVDAGEYHNCDG